MDPYAILIVNRDVSVVILSFTTLELRCSGCCST